MVSRILTTLLITSLWCGAEDYQIANKASANLQIMTASMPTSLYDYSKVWWTAKAPLIAGGSNYVCFAKLCEGNLYSTPSNSMPTIVEINGVRSAYFDGADDYLRATVLDHSTNKISFMIKFKSEGATNPMLYDKGFATSFYCQLITSTKQIEFGGKFQNNVSSFQTPTNSYSTGVVETAIFTIDTVNNIASAYMNGTNIFTTTSYTGVIGTNSLATTIGQKQNAIGDRFKGHIYDFQVFSGIALTSNQAWSISQ